MSFAIWVPHDQLIQRQKSFPLRTLLKEKAGRTDRRRKHWGAERVLHTSASIGGTSVPDQEANGASRATERENARVPPAPAPFAGCSQWGVGALRQSRGESMLVFPSIHVKIICMQKLAAFRV